MNRNQLLSFIAALGILLALLQGVGIFFSLYWHWWWYDLMLHFMGGAFVVLLIFWFCFLSGYTPREMPRTPLFVSGLVLGGVLLIGAGWEVFEYLLGQTWDFNRYWLDTWSDLLADTVGGLIAYLGARVAFPLAPLGGEALVDSGHVISNA